MQGDLIAGLHWFLLFFVVAILISASFLLYYIRCWRATVGGGLLLADGGALATRLACAHGLCARSVLDPGAVSDLRHRHEPRLAEDERHSAGRGPRHGQAGGGAVHLPAALSAGLTALLADAVGFAVLAIIRIQVIQELALTASIGVAILIITNLIMVPILLSYAGVSPKAAERSLRTEMREKSGAVKHNIWRFLDLFTRRKWATVAILVGVVLAGVGFVASRNLKIGDLDPGAPELRPDSLYNRDAAFMHKNYGASSDILAVMVETPNGALRSVRHADARRRIRVATATTQGRGVDEFAGAAEPSGVWDVYGRQLEMVRPATRSVHDQYHHCPGAARVVSTCPATCSCCPCT